MSEGAVFPKLRDRSWPLSLTSEDGNLVDRLYVPALRCAVAYDRMTGYFNAQALALAARGVEGMVANQGRMRLLVGCTLEPAEVEAVLEGAALRDQVERALARSSFTASSPPLQEALALLAWLVAHDYLEVRVAVPTDEDGRPVIDTSIFHAKVGLVTDASGERLAFSGSLNETAAGWTKNWEAITIFTDWGGTAPYVDVQAETFKRLWEDRAQRARVLALPEAARQDLLRYLPPDGQLPARLAPVLPPPAPPVVLPPPFPVPIEPPAGAEAVVPATPTPPPPPPDDALRQRVWEFLAAAPGWPAGGERVGEATSAITPWPHQVRAFQRMYENWPPRLLIADEVGLGKTIEAGLVLRQAWLARRARRILVMAPASVLRQWQIELREKFNLNWPIYDGKELRWLPCRANDGHDSRPVKGAAWRDEPVVLVSSHLMRRKSRQAEILGAPEPWDLVIVDEAHHARRRSNGSDNQLLSLLRGMKAKMPQAGLVLLTATPMQVAPEEVWDLLNILGLPFEWDAERFVESFQRAAKPNPTEADFEVLAMLYRATEKHFGQVSKETAREWAPGLSGLKAGKVLKALREESKIPRTLLEPADRAAAFTIMRRYTPVRRLISRHTRELLRKYHKAGKIQTRIADREVADRFLDLAPAEAGLYRAVEDYISSNYNRAPEKERSAVGFVMTIYRRRLASSFFALRHTLEKRRAAIDAPPAKAQALLAVSADDLDEDEVADEPLEQEDATALQAEALKREERRDLDALLSALSELQVDTKTRHLIAEIQRLRADGYQQVIVFTQYTDTMDYLRNILTKQLDWPVMCFSGRGGELRSGSKWALVGRDEIKKAFREQRADILLCTDAAAEGLNFQFCGALINYDLPWNPMKVEQRIGRIDRLGQKFEKVRIVNLHYKGTVETDVYQALKERIKLFSTVVGKLQPILSTLPKRIETLALMSQAERERSLQAVLEQIEVETKAAEEQPFDLDEDTADDLEMPPQPAPPYDLAALEWLLCTPGLLPAGYVVEPMGAGEYAVVPPGGGTKLRVTVRPEAFEAHPESRELWGPGSPLFPLLPEVPADAVVEALDLSRLQSLASEAKEAGACS